MPSLPSSLRGVGFLYRKISVFKKLLFCLILRNGIDEILCSVVVESVVDTGQWTAISFDQLVDENAEILG